MLRIIPMNHKQANEFVRQHHRHHKPTLGAKFCVGVADVSDVVRGVAIVGRPVARALDDGFSLEVTRLCTDGAFNAASMLLGACRRIARELGYRRLYTYTLPEEGGASLRAANFKFDGNRGRPSKDWHSRSGRTAGPIGDDRKHGKWRWRADL